MKNLTMLLFPMIMLITVGGIENKALGADSLFISLADTIDIIVAADGSGDYTSLQAAINSVPNNNANRKIIYIRNGYYYEKIVIPATKTNITLIGENVDSTIIDYDDYSGKVVGGVEIGTSTSYSFSVSASNFIAMNLTISNSAGDVGQAVALLTEGDKQSFLHCRLIGYQDTYYTKGHKRNYLKDCFIEGATDYIFGRTTVVFDSCQIHSVKSGSYITAASTEPDVAFGYVFFNCKLTAEYGLTGINLGRPWRADARTVFYECEEGSFLNSAGWSIWNGNTNHETCFYAEYNCFGPGSDTANRVSWSHQLTEEQAAAYTIDNIFSKATNPSEFSGNWLANFDNNYFYQLVKSHTVKFMDSVNYNTYLSSILLDGGVIDQFNRNIRDYVVELPEGTSDVPQLEGILDDSLASLTIHLPSNLPGKANLSVLARDGATNESYSVYLSVDSAYNDASLRTLKVDYKDIPEFQPDVYEYDVVLPYGTTKVPRITASTNVSGSSRLITPPTEVAGSGTVQVTALDGIHQTLYTITFSIGPSALKEPDEKEQVQILNPFYDEIILSGFPEIIAPVSFEIFNLLGVKVMAKNFEPSQLVGGTVNINSYGLSKGVYIYRLTINSATMTGKIIKGD